MKSVLTISFLVLTSCSSIDWQGHRGARGLYPENTIGGMSRALEYPINTLEFDVVVTRDHEVILSHEPWMNPEICDVSSKLNIYQMSAAEVAKIDCGLKNHPRFPHQEKVKASKPKLSEVLTLFKDSGKKFNIEIKSTVADEKNGFQPKVEKFVELVITEIRKHLKDEQFTIQSFDFRVLKELHARYPEISTVALVEKAYSPEKLFEALGFKPSVYSPYYKTVHAQDVQAYQKFGLKVIPWTVNTVPEMKKLIKDKVDGIITDYPNLIDEAQH